MVDKNKPTVDKDKMYYLMKMRQKYKITWKELYGLSTVIVIFYLLSDILGYWWIAWLLFLFLALFSSSPEWINEEIKYELTRREE